VGDYDTRLQQALRATGIGVWSVDVLNEGRLWAQGCAELLGVPHDALDVNTALNTVHPEDREQLRELAHQAIADGGGFEADYRIVTREGPERWLRVKACAHRNAAGRVDRIQGVLQDVSERKHLEIDLRESQRELAGVISHLPGAVYRCQNDAQWSADFVSEGITALTGYTRADFEQGRVTFLDLTHPEDREKVRAIVQSALANREAYQAMYRIVTRSGEEKWVWEQGTGVYSSEHDLQFLEGLLFDISRTRRAEEENARLERRLRQAQKMESLGTLAGGIAHDFNNVLAAISGNAALALADLPPDSPVCTSINEIRRSAARAADLVRQILAFSRQEETQRKPMALQTAVAEVSKLLRASLPAAIEIRCHCATHLPNILADATQIHQVVMNLGVNASQAIGDHSGVIEFRIDTQTLTQNSNSQGLPAGRYVRLRVIDTGAGMDQKTLERIYDPFFTTKPVGKGTGLGLSVVHGIVQSHGGTISIESSPGQGSTFCVLLPAISFHAVDTIAAKPAPRGHGQRILFVDDEEALVFLAERSLRRLGYQVTASTDPAGALNTFRAQPTAFDCVVTDMSMPGMSGQELARELLKIRSDVPIVLASGHLRAEDVQTAREIGIRDVMRKPDTIDELSRVLDDILRQRPTAPKTLA
jgi:PAS domain S-box-containing protein